MGCSTKIGSIVVVNKFKIARDSVTKILQSDVALTVVGTYPALPEARNQIEHLAPDVLLIDVTDSAGCEPINELIDIHPGIMVVAWGISLNPEEIILLAQSGVSGYVTLDASEDQCLETVKGVLKGELSNPKVAGILNRYVYHSSKTETPKPTSRSLQSRAERPATGVQLTIRETEVIRLIDRGMSNKEIARELNVELSTIKNHVHAILGKFRVTRRIQAAAQYRSLSQGSLSA